MKKSRKLIATLLTLVFTLTFCVQTAFATSETYTGSYNGYGYVCTASVTSASCSASMTSGSSETLLIMATISYINTDNEGDSYISRVSNTKSIKAGMPSDVKRFSSIRANYSIGGTRVETISLAV